MDNAKLENFRVLVVDDSNTIRSSANIFLGQAKCKATMASSGYDALALLEDIKPQLIFMDVLMPDLDGYQTCTLIKSNSMYRDIPVVFLTSRNSAFDEARGALAGANEYMAKPFTREALIEVASRYAAQSE